MLPRWHILYGAILTAVLWFLIPGIDYLYLALFFLASFLIDFDHYLKAVARTKKIGLFNALRYYRDKKHEFSRRKEMHIFHTIEFHVFVGLLGLTWIGFFYIFMGMIVHSLIDLISMASKDKVNTREYFFSKWLRQKLVG